MIITIKEVRDTSGGKGKVVKTMDGQTMSCFDPVILPNLKVGATLNITTEPNGNYTHIKSAGATEVQPSPQPVQSVNKPVTPPAVSNPQPISREASIEMQVALKCLTELGVAKLLDIVTYDALIAKLSKMAGLEFVEVKPAKPQPIQAVKG